MFGITVRIGAAYDEIRLGTLVHDRAAKRIAGEHGDTIRLNQTIVGLYQKEPTFAPKKPKGKKARKAAVAKS